MVELAASTVGARLKAERESRGVTLASIEATTKISRRALMAIERDDRDELPGGIFARAFVRSYAKALGLDAESTVRDFMAQFPPDESEPIEQLGAAASHRVRVPAGVRAAAPFGLASLPLLAGIVWLSYGSASARTHAPLRGDRVAAAAIAVPAPALRPVAIVTPASQTAARSSLLNLVLRTRSACWVSAAADGRTIVERLVNAGEVVELSAERVVAFKVGDAGAIAMQINGEPARSLGSPGQVVSARIDRSNLRDFLPTP